MRRCQALLSVLLLLMLAARVHADDPEKSYNTLFGEEARRVKQSSSAKEPIAFARKLLNAAKELDADKPLQALLYQKACEFTQANPEGIPVAIEAMEALAKADPAQAPAAQEKIVALLERAYRTATGDKRRDAARRYAARIVELAEAQVAAGNLDKAVQLYRPLTPILPIAGGDIAMEAPARILELTSRQIAEKRVNDILKHLTEKPDDAKAAAELIIVLLVDLDQPAEAVKQVARAGDSALESICTLAAKPPDQLRENEALDLGNWYKLQSARSTPFGKLAALRHARSCLENYLALHTAHDAQRLKAKTTLDEVRAALDVAGAPSRSVRVIKLLPLIDPAAGSVDGKWHMEDGELVAGGTGQERLQIPYSPPKEYDYRVEFTVPERMGLIMAIVSGRKHNLNLVLTRKSTTFHYLEGEGVFDNRTTRRLEAPLTSDRRHTVVLKVRSAAVRAYLDGQLINELATDFRNLSDQPFWALRDRSLLGVASGDSKTVFHNIEVVEVTGQGTVKR